MGKMDLSDDDKKFMLDLHKIDKKDEENMKKQTPDEAEITSAEQKDMEQDSREIMNDGL
jgi:hypothetical protein